MTEPHKKYIVERRWKKPPPAPHTNEWEMIASYDYLGYAQQAAHDNSVFQPAWEYRVVS